MATSGSLGTSKTTYNNYTQSCVFNWTSSSNQDSMEHTVSWELDLKNGYATIYGAVVTINGVNYSTGNLNVSSPGNGQYARKYINKGTVKVIAGSDGQANLSVSITVHIASSALNSTGSSSWSLPQLLKPEEYLPIISSFTLQDTNSSILALTGDNQRIIVKYSNVKANYVASGQRGATITKVDLINGSKIGSSTSSSGSITINGIEDVTFTLRVTDSKGNQRNQSITMTKINYIELTNNSTLSRLNPTSETVNVRFEGLCYTGSFGSVANQIKARYRFKETNKTAWSDYKTVSIPSSSNKYETDIHLDDSFEYQKSYDIELYVYDNLNATGVKIANGYVRMGIPDFMHNSDHFVVANDLYTIKNGEYEKYLPVKVISSTTPSNINVGTLIVEDASIFDNYMVLGYMVFHSGSWYQWYNTAVNGVYITAQGINMMISSASIANEPIMIFLMRIE